MANRFWVGGAGTWDAATTTNWSATTGGGGGASVPGVTDDIFFDGNSGVGTVTVTAAPALGKSMTCTGYTGTITGSSNINLRGSLLLVAGMGWSETGTIGITTNSASLTCGGKTLGALTVNGIGITVTAQDSMIVTNAFTLTNGSFVGNGFDHSVGSFSSNNANTRTLDITNKTLSLTLIGTLWNTSNSTGMTFTNTGSTVKINTAAGSNARIFTSGTLNFNNFWITGANTGNVTITNSATFADFKSDVTVGYSLKFTAGITITTTTFHCSGQVSGILGMISTVAGSIWTLSCASGTVISNYVLLQDSTASGGATFNATNAQNVSNNSGWNFSNGSFLLAM